MLRIVHSEHVQKNLEFITTYKHKDGSKLNYILILVALDEMLVAY
jgi:hypothetical protein